MRERADCGNRVTTSIYDAVGKRTQRVNARGQVVTATCNANRGRIREVYPGGRIHTFTYDDAGNRTVMADATGVSTCAQTVPVICA